MDQAKTNAYSRTMVMYHQNSYLFSGAALAGAKLWTSPGTEDWAFMPLNGIGSFPMTATHRANITARNGNATELLYGVNITFQGMMANGGFIDTKRGIDALTSTIKTNVFGAMVAASKAGSKIPMTDPGIAVIEAQTRAGLDVFAPPPPAVGFLDPTTVQITVPLAANISSSDRTARTLNGVQFSATTQGSTHKVTILGTVSGS